MQYTYTIEAIEGDVVVSFNGDQAIRQFDFLSSNDLSLSGPVSTDYKITVTAVAGNIVEQSASAEFTLTLKNPCIDPNYVTI